MSAPEPEDVVEELRAIAAERPTYRYRDEHDTCSYAEGGAPSCIVGHWLARRGFGPQVLSHWDFVGAIFAGDYGQADELAEIEVEDEWCAEFGESVALVLGAAQWIQDNGGTWSEAVAEAEEMAQRVVQP